MADCAPEGVDGPGADAPEVSLELGERHLDRVQVWRVERAAVISSTREGINKVNSWRSLSDFQRDRSSLSGAAKTAWLSQLTNRGLLILASRGERRLIS